MSEGLNAADGVVLFQFDKKSSLGAALINQLSDLGFKNIVESKNPSTSTDIVRTALPAVILLDWDVAPFYQNSEFLQKLRKANGGQSVPVIVCADVMTEELLAIAGEYDVEKIFTKQSVRASFKLTMVQLVEDLNQPPPLRKLFLKLDEAAAQKKVDEFVTIVRQLYESHPTVPRVQVEYAKLLLNHGNMEEAEKIAKKASKVTNHGVNLRATNILSRILMKRGEFKEASELLNKADILSPNNVERLILMGDCYFGLGDKGMAKLKYETAVKVDGNSQEAKKSLGMFELSEGEINRALALFHQSTTEDELASIFNTAGVLAAQRKQYQRAIHLYEAAKKPIQAPELLSKVCFNMGLAYRRWNKLGEAELWFNEALGLNPKFEKAQKHLDGMKQGDLVAADEMAVSIEADFPEPPAAKNTDLILTTEAPKPKASYAYGAAVFPEKKKAPKKSKAVEEISLSSPKPFDDDEEDL